MKALTKMLLVALLVVGLTNVATAVTDTGTASVGVQVEEIAQLSVSGAPALMTLTNAATTAGSLPTAQTDAATSLSWTSNVALNSRLITASLNLAYSTGVVVKLTLGTPGTGSTNGTTGGQQTLGISESTLFSGITNENAGSATLTYELSLSAMTAPITTTESKTVTITLAAAAV